MGLVIKIGFKTVLYMDIAYRSRISTQLTSSGDSLGKTGTSLLHPDWAQGNSLGTRTSLFYSSRTPSNSLGTWTSWLYSSHMLCEHDILNSYEDRSR